jgi:hypothetical protein
MTDALAHSDVRDVTTLRNTVSEVRMKIGLEEPDLQVLLPYEMRH